MRFFVLLFLLVSCGNDDLKKYSRLEGLRILAITADAPEINSAATVNLTPYLSYTNGGDTTLNVSYEACIDPGIAFGAEVSCDTYEPAQVVTGSTTYNTSLIGSANYYTGPMASIGVAIPASAFVALGLLDSDLQFNGVDMLVIFTITDQSNPSATLKVLKKISLTSKTSGLNNNTTLGGDMQVNGSNIAAFPTSKVNLSLDSPSAGESYDFITADGLTTLNERTSISWFSNVGAFQFSRTDADEAVEFDPEGATAGVLVGVYRDNRGGVVVIRKVY
jgi:hypothetical protein